MKRFWPFAFAWLLVSGVVAVLAAGSPAATEPRNPAGGACNPGDETNLITNPSFEGEYSAYIPPDGHPDCPFGICQTAQMAPGWTPWWRSHDDADPPWIIRMPEWKPADPQFSNPPRVRTGDAAQQYFTFFSTHEAGFYQQVTVTSGTEYCFEVWGHSWSADDDDDAFSGPFDGILNQKVGIDPTGGTEWTSANIIWGAERLQYDVYGLFAVTATAQAEQMTVFVYSQPQFAVKHNDVFWDDAALQATMPPVSIGPAGGYTFLAAVAEPKTFTESLLIDLPGNPPPTWTLALDPAGTLFPALSAPSGTAGDVVSFTLDSAVYPAGFYSTTLLFSTTPDISPDPIAVSIRLYVLEQILPTYLPATWRE